jgi:hypothetical protein
MDLVRNGEVRASVTVHLGGELAAKGADFLVAKFRERSGFELPVKRAVGFDDITRCCQISLCSTHTSDLQENELTTPDGQGRRPIPEEGFVADLARVGSDVGVILSGRNLGNLVCGIGELLRGIEFGPHTARLVRLPPTIFQPHQATRGVCLHMPPGSAYAEWPETELARLFENWAFWDVNAVLTRYDMYAYRSDFRSVPNSEGNRMLARHQLVAKLAQDLGMKFGLAVAANSGYLDRAIVSLRARDSETDSRRGGSPTLLCPSSHDGRAYLLQDREELFRQIRPIDLLWILPYDPGGCWCERCDPWVKTFLGLAQEIARGAQRYHSQTEVYVSTRWFQPQEFQFLEEYLGHGPEWLRGIIVDESRLRSGPRGLADFRSLVSRLSGICPTIFAPELDARSFSTDGRNQCVERGRFGASPRLESSLQAYAQIAPHISGTVVQSDCISDDISKVSYCRWGWSLPPHPADAVREYWRWHFGGAEDEGWDLVRRLEKNQTHSSAEDAQKECQSLAAAEKGIRPDERNSWRWKVLRARVELDDLLSQIEPASEMLSQAAADLRKATRSASRPKMVQAGKAWILRLKERDKRIQKLIKTADDLQSEVYRVSPERQSLVSGMQLAEECGRGSGQDWIRKLQQALKPAGPAEVKAGLDAVADEMAPR